MNTGMTLQEAFEKIWQYFVIEKHGPSMQANKCGVLECAYRGDNGARCAIGVLIPDAQYSRGMEQKSASAIYSKVPALHSIDRILLDRLQTLHDLSASCGSEFARVIETRLCEFACDHNLQIPGEAMPSLDFHHSHRVVAAETQDALPQCRR